MKNQTKKMNVLFIIADQHRADHMSCAGNPVLKTPNLDKLASEGVHFTSTYCANPICSPNRASLLTGLYPNMHGLRSNGINLPENVPTIPEILSNNGYHTHAVGKMHLQWWAQKLEESARSYESVNQWFNEELRYKMKENLPSNYYGFEELEMILGHGDICAGHYFDWLEERAPQYLPIIREKGHKFFLKTHYKTDIPEELYSTTYVTERSIAYLERYSKGEYGNKPFFLFASYPDPHHPVTPPGKYWDMYKPEEINFPESFNDQENLKNHKFLGKLLDMAFFRGMVLRTDPENLVREFIAATYGAVSMVDHGIGQILDALEKLGFADNTIIIYTSDHGDMMGDHGLILKGPCPFDGILRVPLIWKVPGITKGGTSNSLVSSIDIPKTILELVQIQKNKQPYEIQGTDITPILNDPSEKVRDFCLVEHDEELHNFGINIRLRHLVTENYKLTIYNGLKGYGDLFDRKNDPLELNNLWYSHPDLRNGMIERLLYENLNAQSRYPRRIAVS